ncbi:MAG: MarR family transcriptional regulator [Candidatus Eisenbacteria bacterium]|nr:MarR family transcriptional regulator [Candidatus Eisenbacteria bacterium]
MPATPETCAREILETVPLVMAAIRCEMRRIRGSDLTIPQFRTLLYIGRKPESSLSRVADHIGLTLPSMSKLVDGLVDRALVRRVESRDDRRRVALSLTREGADLVGRVRAAGRRSIARRLSPLPQEARGEMLRAMQALRGLFEEDRA